MSAASPITPAAAAAPGRRVTLVTQSLASGGAERALVALANAWAAKGWSVTLLTFSGAEDAPFYPLDPRVEHRPLGLARPSLRRGHAVANNLRRLGALRAAIRAARPEVVVASLAKVNVMAILATRGLGLPVVVCEQIDPARFPLARPWAWLRRLTYPFSSALVAVSGGTLARFRGAARRKGRVIPNPAIAHDEPAPGPRRNEIVAVGRMKPQKGFDLLLRAFASVAKEFPDWTLKVWGEGPLRPQIEDLRAGLGLDERVGLPGRSRAIGAELKQAKIFVMSSRFEGFPLALCEAMGCGLPAISFDCPSGPGEIIRDGVDGLLVEPENVQALARAMARLMGDEALRERLAARAPEVLDRFGLARVVAEWEAVIDEVLGRRAAR